MEIWRGTSGLSAGLPLTLAALLLFACGPVVDSHVAARRTATPVTTPTGHSTTPPSASQSAAIADPSATQVDSPLPSPSPTPVPPPAPNGLTTSLVAGAGTLLLPAPGASADPAAGAYVDGPAAQACFRQPEGLAFDARGALLIFDTVNNSVRRLAGGQVTTVVGQPPPATLKLDVDVRGQALFPGKGTMAGVRHLVQPAVTSDGTIYVAEIDNTQIVRIGPPPDYDTVYVAGLTVPGNADGPRTTASFSSPYAMALGPDGALYLSDDFTIRRITLPDFSVSTFAGKFDHHQPDGTSVAFRDGPADEALFGRPRGLAFDKAGNLYVADFLDNRIRMIAPDRTVSTIAGGDEGAWADGPGLQARFYQPTGLAYDPAGRLIVADTGNNLVRAIDLAAPTHTVTTLAGSGIPGYFEGPAMSARFNRPQAVLVDPSGGVLVADTQNHRIRKIAP